MINEFKTTKKRRCSKNDPLAVLKKELVKVASQLGYSKEIKQQIKDAQTETEAYRAMANGRSNL